MELKKITWVFIAFFLMMAGCKTKAYTASEYLSTNNYVDIYIVTPFSCQTHIIINENYSSVAFLIRNDNDIVSVKTANFKNDKVLKENIERIAQFKEATIEPQPTMGGDKAVMYVRGERKINNYRNVPKELDTIYDILFKKYGMRNLYDCFQ
ncbi:MAG: hypothetical protein ACRCVU_11445 [Flavobacterium sp.]